MRKFSLQRSDHTFIFRHHHRGREVYDVHAICRTAFNAIGPLNKRIPQQEGDRLGVAPAAFARESPRVLFFFRSEIPVAVMETIEKVCGSKFPSLGQLLRGLIRRFANVVKSW